MTDTSYVPSASGGKVNRPPTSVLAFAVRLFSDAVTSACATGAPLLVTVPVRKALALPALDGAAHAMERVRNAAASAPRATIGALSARNAWYMDTPFVNSSCAIHARTNIKLQ
ncbi:MAG TPA: hypothetical protein VKT51_10330 [Candidatus Eremiobacteraceae bacterium]|nr:hypothetical protein [Candidatus Eremiobacteraceae bacterium]